jgi:hypothetical protein
MNAMLRHASLAVVALAGPLFASAGAFAQSAAAATGPWARMPVLPTTCFENVATNTADPFYMRLEAAKAAIAADRERQAAINAQIEEEFRNIDPMVKAQRMQQWMMSHPQEAMAYMQAAQAAPALGHAEQEAHEQQRRSRAEAWQALKQSYDRARIEAYAPIEARRKALAGRVGYTYSATPKDLVEPWMHFFQDPGTSSTDWNEGESISGELDRKYKALCPQWWGANGRFHAHLHGEKQWFMGERTRYLTRFDAPKLQQYAIMNTPAASYRSTAAQQAAVEYLDLVYKVFGERDTVSRCDRPRDCDGTYP